MIINRHNYEEFFLLYVDNELPPGDRAAVESFVQQNPDLADEMDMLKQTTLPDEKIEFGQKELLYNQPGGITLNNYEEYFLLSVDNELSETESEEVEKFVLKHPELQSEYTLLSQARLEPETITFAGKEKLYRKEGNERPVILSVWMKLSIAAAIIGLIATTWIVTKNDQMLSVNHLVASSPKVVKTPSEKIKQPVVKETVAAVHEKPGVKAVAEKKVVAKPRPAKVRNEALAINPNKNKPSETVGNNKITQRVEMSLPKNNSSNDAIASTKPVNKNNLPVVNEDRINTTFTDNQAEVIGTPLATEAVYREIDNRQEDDERTFYIGSAEINKNKLKGLFKKAASLIGKKADRDDGEKTLKIAGFEIKSK